MSRVIGCILFLLLSLAGAGAQVPAVQVPESPPPAAQPDATPEAKPDGNSEPTSEAQQSMCLLLESAARANDLPVEFFARVIWQESRFRPDAVGPLTRSGKRALGIAQFMPGTAAERNLLDPLNPIEALPKSAEFLRDLRQQFGNLGLAAAAYNAGPRRVREWMAGAGPMPSETRGYVQAITGASVEQWAKGGDADPKQKNGATCDQLMALLKRAPNTFVAALQQRIVTGAMAPWGAIVGADKSRSTACCFAMPSCRSATRRYWLGATLFCSNAAEARCRVIKSGSELRRARPPTIFAAAFTKRAAIAWCCAIRGVDRPLRLINASASITKKGAAEAAPFVFRPDEA